MKKIKKKVISMFLVTGIMISLAYPAFASIVRDNDSNAIVYGGAETVSELKRKLENGSGPNPGAGVYGNYQSPNGVRTFYNAIGIYEDQFGRFKEGKVFKDGRVCLGTNLNECNQEITRGVFSAGRVNMGASTLRTYGSIPIYWREPKYSFKSNSLPAFVYLNSDKSFGYAIVKACGNPVTNNTLRANIKNAVVVPPPVTPTYKLTVKKFDDINHNGKKESTESYISGWKFTVSGNGIKKSGLTKSDGSFSFTGLTKGSYAVWENHRDDWKNSTGGEKKLINLTENRSMLFGNTRLYEITVRKYHDTDGNGDKGLFEAMLPDFNFTLSGEGVTKSATTNSDGRLVFTDLVSGQYTVTEAQKTGWVSTTGLSQIVNIGPSNTVYFGNRKIFDLKVSKFRDDNGNGVRENSEIFLPGWQFQVTGNGVDKMITTGMDGTFTLENLPEGVYTVVETQKTGWRSTTGLTERITLNADSEAIFGNAMIPRIQDSPEESVIRIMKFHDKNADGVKDSGEKFLANWKFRLTGNGVDLVGKTDENGELVFGDLEDGRYNIKETLSPGWINTVGNNTTVELSDGDDLTILVGNTKTSTPARVRGASVKVREKGEVKGAFTGSLPQSGAGTVAFSLTSIGTGAYYWLRSKKILISMLKK